MIDSELWVEGLRVTEAPATGALPFAGRRSTDVSTPEIQSNLCRISVHRRAERGKTHDHEWRS
jgi:hypothetical protein